MWIKKPESSARYAIKTCIKSPMQWKYDIFQAWERNGKFLQYVTSCLNCKAPVAHLIPFFPPPMDKTTQTLPSAAQHPDHCLLSPCQHLVQAAGYAWGQPCRSFTCFAPAKIPGLSHQQELSLATSLYAGKLCASRSISQGMTPAPAHSPAYRFSLRRTISTQW